MNFFVRKKKKEVEDNGDLVLENRVEIVCTKEAVEEIQSFLRYGDNVDNFIKNIEREILHGSATIEATNELGKILWICNEGEIPIYLENYPEFSVRRNEEVITYCAYDFCVRKRYRKDEAHELITNIRDNHFSKILTQEDKKFFIEISGGYIRPEVVSGRRDIDDYLMSLDLDKLPKVTDVAEKVLGMLKIEREKFQIEYSMNSSGLVARTVIKYGKKEQIGIMDDENQVYNLLDNRSWSFSKPGYGLSFHASKNSSGKVTYVVEKENLDFSPAQEFEQVQKKVEELFAEFF